MLGPEHYVAIFFRAFLRVLSRVALSSFDSIVGNRLIDVFKLQVHAWIHQTWKQYSLVGPGHDVNEDN